MNDGLRLRHRLTTAALAALLLAPSAAAAGEVSLRERGTGLVIHDADETMSRYCRWEGDRLVFALPGAAGWELVTTTSDPAIANPGDGSFHAFDAVEVRAALDAVRFPLQRVAAEIFILPFPRRASLESAAGPGVILLSPGVRALSAAQQHAELTHELGHVVQYALLADADTLGWSRYRRLRGIEDLSRYTAAAAHVDRPHEIFAEDFRVLFGGALATTSGSIENGALAYPTSVSGLADFMIELAHAAPAVSPLAVFARHSGGAVVLARGGEGAPVLDLFDVMGRRVAAVAATQDAAGCHWSWDGCSAAGQRVAATVLFARARDGRGGVARITLVP